MGLPRILTVLVLAPLASAQLVVLDSHQLVPVDAAPESYFGASVAVAQELFVVGAHEDDGVPNAILGSGAVVVYETDPGGMPQEVARLTALDAQDGDGFGTSVASDGLRLVSGAPRLGPDTDGPGAAYVFARTPTGWEQEARLVATGGLDGDGFGACVAIDGACAVVGTFGPSGGAFVFEHAGSWGPSQALVPGDGLGAGEFGRAVALDGERIAVGAPGFDSSSGYDSGAVYLFVRDHAEPGGWREEARLELQGAGTAAHFGRSVALDGERLVVGASNGSLYVYDRSQGTWGLDQSLPAPEGTTFGAFVDVDGDVLVASGPGKAWCFRREIAWELALELTPACGGSGLDETPAALAGSRILVGAPSADSGAGPHSGTALAVRVVAPFRRLCFGDGSGATCPCGALGAPFAGCPNSVGGGARLEPRGSSSRVASDLGLDAAGLPPGVSMFLFAGDVVRFARPYGDGLRCAGGNMLRLPFVQSDSTGRASWTPPTFDGLFAPGDEAVFQAWYRDPHAACGGGSNFTSALAVAFVP